MTTLSFSNARIKWALIILFLLWLFSLVIMFYVTQKPFSIATIQSFAQAAQIEETSFTFSGQALGQTALNLLTALWLWVLSLGRLI